MDKWAPGITRVVHCNLGGRTPAAVNRETGVMYVDPRYKGLSQDQWYFIMLHELGHLKEQTKNELQADKWAHEQYMSEGRSLKKSVYALTDLLNFNKPEDMARAKEQLRRAQIKDGKEMNYSGEFSGVCYKTDFSNHWLPYGFSNYDSRYNEYFLGKFGNWIKTKAAPAVGKVIGAVTGLSGGSAPAGTIVDNSSIAQVLAAQANTQAQQEAARQAQAAKDAETRNIILIVAVVIVVLGITGFLIFRKK